MARRGSNAPLSDAQGRRATFAVAVGHVHVLFGGASARRCLCFRWVFGCWGACGPCSLCAALAHGPPANVSSLRRAVRPRPAVPSQPEPRLPRWPFCFISRCPCPGCHVQHSVAQSDAGEFASCVFLQESYGFTAHSHAVNAARVHFCTFCVFECISITGSSVRTAAAAARCGLLSITLHRDGRQLSTRRGFPCDFSVPCDLAPPCSFY